MYVSKPTFLLYMHRDQINSRYKLPKEKLKPTFYFLGILNPKLTLKGTCSYSFNLFDKCKGNNSLVILYVKITTTTTSCVKIDRKVLLSCYYMA